MTNSFRFETHGFHRIVIFKSWDDFLNVRSRRTPRNRPLLELFVEAFQEVDCRTDLYVRFLMAKNLKNSTTDF